MPCTDMKICHGREDLIRVRTLFDAYVLYSYVNSRFGLFQLTAVNLFSCMVNRKV